MIYYMSYSIIIKGRTSAKHSAKSIERERKLAKQQQQQMHKHITIEATIDDKRY